MRDFYLFMKRWVDRREPVGKCGSGADKNYEESKADRKDHLYGIDNKPDYGSVHTYSQFLFSLKTTVMSEVIRMAKLHHFFAILLDESTDKGGWVELGVLIRFWSDVDKAVVTKKTGNEKGWIRR
jgi:hypothetical protein